MSLIFSTIAGADINYKGNVAVNDLPFHEGGDAAVVSGYTTWHGFQLARHWSVGAGLGFYNCSFTADNLWNDNKHYVASRTRLAAFGALHYQTRPTRWAFTTDMQAGAWLHSGDGIYLNLAPGVRYGLGNGRFGLTMSVVYALYDLSKTFDQLVSGLQNPPVQKHALRQHVGFRLTFDF